VFLVEVQFRFLLKELLQLIIPLRFRLVKIAFRMANFSKAREKGRGNRTKQLLIFLFRCIFLRFAQRNIIFLNLVCSYLENQSNALA
jgi:hypothetical protein